MTSMPRSTPRAEEGSRIHNLDSGPPTSLPLSPNADGYGMTLRNLTS
jgi:hypothetical protein